MRQRQSCISHGSNVEQNALRSWHAGSNVQIRYIHGALRSGYATMRNAQCNNSEDNLFELSVYMYFTMNATVTLSTDVFKAIHLVKSTNYPRNCHDIKFIP